MKGYAGKFILKRMAVVFKLSPTVIMNGTKIQIIKHSNIKTIDSINFFNTRLRVLPKIFDLSVDGKGYFPHIFNKLENWE